MRIHVNGMSLSVGFCESAIPLIKLCKCQSEKREKSSKEEVVVAPSSSSRRKLTHLG